MNDFTTGEAAKVCRCSQQTIIRCFDKQMLKGYRIPGSRFRRIPPDALRAFMDEHGIPTDRLGSETGQTRTLRFDQPQPAEPKGTLELVDGSTVLA